jgi:hypothetical protein
MNHNSLKKELDEILLISNDFLNSNLAKELVLKDDEKTPKPLNEKIRKELEDHLDMKVKYIDNLNLESLPVEIFNEEYKMNVMSSKSTIEEVKNDVNSLDFSIFKTLRVINEGKYYVFYYEVNKKYDGEVFIVFILATQRDNPKNRIMFGELRGGMPLPKMFPMERLETSLSYDFTAITNRGELYNLK